MLPRVIWQLVMINHNQDGGRHCLRESGAPEADRVWEQVHAPVPLGKSREEKEELEEEKQKKGNKNSISPPMLFPSAMLSRE